MDWSTIHPAIKGKVQDDLEAGKFAPAILSLFIEINTRVKNYVKSETGKELDGAGLMTEAFSVKNPIIVLGDINTKTGKNIQNGYMRLFEGAMMGIRNPLAHGNILDEDQAVHIVHLASLLMRKLDEAEAKRSRELVWKKASSSDVQLAIEDRECAWSCRWPPKRVEDIELTYDEDKGYELPELEDAIELLRSQLDSGKFDDVNNQPHGSQVRVERVKFLQGVYKFQIQLVPTKFLYYVAIHQNLSKTELAAVRQRVFENAVKGPSEGRFLDLPSQFALHMAVVSVDGRALLRLRSSQTELYGEVWEAGVGEFMHGPESPDAKEFPHFNEEGLPDLSRYLRMAVKEELDYAEARSEDFRIYGFGVEKQTLAPKLMVVYTSDLPIDELLEGAKRSKDPPIAVDKIDLTPSGIVESSNKLGGPTSKLALMLALTQHAPPADPSSRINEVLRLVRDSQSTP